MAETTKIEWATATFNCWIGCSKVARECAHCYAEAVFDKRRHVAVWGDHGTRVLTSEAYWRKPLKWNADAALTVGDGPMFGKVDRPRVFCASLADVFEDWQGPMQDHKGRQLFTINGTEFFTEAEYPDCRPVTMGDVRARLFRLIDATPNLNWLLLTKRPENILRMWPCRNDNDGDGNCHLCSKTPDARCRRRENVWLGTSAGTQATANRAIPELMKVGHLSPVLFVSAEPLLEPVFLRMLDAPDGRIINALSGEVLEQDGSVGTPLTPIGWTIVGGESGLNARPMHPIWLESIIEQCQHHKTPILVKQWGEWLPFNIESGCLKWGSDCDGGPRRIIGAKVDGKTYSTKSVEICDSGEIAFVRVGKANAGRMFRGVEYNEFPCVGE